MSEFINRKIVLASRPNGMPTQDNFRLEREPVPELSEGQYLARNLWLSLDPYMRGRMSDAKSYVAPFALNETMGAETVAQIVRTKNSEMKVGDFLSGGFGWQDFFIADSSSATGRGRRKLDPNDLPLTTALGVLGNPGLTAYFGLLKLGKPQKDETLVVSAASGAVGSAVGQIAKIKGLRVVGVAGGKMKCDYCVNDLGFDACIDYKAGQSLDEALEEACPDGIDVYFENVGGAVLEAVAKQLNKGSRVPICGSISQYNSNNPVYPGTILSKLPNPPENRFFTPGEWANEYPQAFSEMVQWVKEGKIKYKESIVEGLENAPEAFIGILNGKNFGKQLIKIADPSTL